MQVAWYCVWNGHELQNEFCSLNVTASNSLKLFDEFVTPVANLYIYI
jgi:hypothetical protein